MDLGVFLLAVFPGDLTFDLGVVFVADLAGVLRFELAGVFVVNFLTDFGGVSAGVARSEVGGVTTTSSVFFELFLFFVVERDSVAAVGYAVFCLATDAALERVFLRAGPEELTGAGEEDLSRSRF